MAATANLTEGEDVQIIGGTTNAVTFIAEHSVRQLRTPGEVLDHLLWYVNSRVIDEVSTRGTGFHAAAVQRDGKALLLPAESGSGKSTLAASLVRSGWTYLSDEAVELEASTGHLLSYPKPITLDVGAHHLFPEIRPRIEDTESWYVNPGAWGPRPDYRPGTPSAVVLPRYSPGSPLNVELLPPGPALMALAPTTFQFARDPERNLRALGRLVRGTPVVRMTYGSLEQSLDGISQVLSGHAA